MRVLLIALIAAISYAQTESISIPETSVENRRELFLRGAFRRVGNWFRDRWADTVQIVERVARVTGIDRIVHQFTGGDRIFNLDGSYNNELLQNVVQKAVIAIEDVFEATGLDNLVHKVTGGCRVVSRDGSYNNECIDDLKELVLKLITQSLFDKAEEIFEDILRSGDVVLDIIQKAGPTAQEVDLLVGIMQGDVNLFDAEDRKKLGDILENRILKIVDQIRYGIGLVDGQKPVLVFGTGVGCGASYLLNAEASLDMFRKIPTYPGDLAEVSITASAAVGIGASAGASCGQPYHFSFNTNPSDASGLGVTISIQSVAYGGIQVDFGFALMQDNKAFKLSTISIAPSVGAQAGITASLTYTTVIATINNIPVDPVTDQIERPAASCAEESGVCECNGYVRYGYGESWHVLDDPIEGSIGCNNDVFGDPLPGQRKICQCIQGIYGDHGSHFELRGNNGDEIVTLTDGESQRTIQLSTDWKMYSANSANIVISTNAKDMGSNDVFFRARAPTKIRSNELFEGWRCGTSMEDINCGSVRVGQLHWKTDYQIKFTSITPRYYSCSANNKCEGGTACRIGDRRCLSKGDCDYANQVDGTSRDCSILESCTLKKLHLTQTITDLLCPEPHEPNRTPSAVVCDAQQYNMDLHLSLANHMFAHCGSHCLYDVSDYDDSITYVWHTSRNCWDRDVNDGKYSCLSNAEAAIVRDRRFDLCNQNHQLIEIVNQISQNEQLCDTGHWLNVYPPSAAECAHQVLARDDCDNNYFSWANLNDNNCRCVSVGTNCRNKLVHHPAVTTWQINTDNIFAFQIIQDGHLCNQGYWLKVYPRSALQCARLVLTNPSCDDKYFSWANLNDNNCFCVKIGTDCKSDFRRHGAVTTWQISIGKPPVRIKETNEADSVEYALAQDSSNILAAPANTEEESKTTYVAASAGYALVNRGFTIKVLALVGMCGTFYSIFAWMKQNEDSYKEILSEEA